METSKAKEPSQPCGRVAGAYVQGSTEPKGVRALRFAEVSNTRLLARTPRDYPGDWPPVLSNSMVNRVSQQPSSNPAIRRACRVITMVHELHKAGYQRLRISSGMSPSGVHWRCHITHAGNIGANGWEIVDWGRDVVTYSAGDEDRFFGFADGAGKSARQLAQMFVDRFPELADRAEGKDRQYVGWYVEMTGAAELGRLPIFFADYDLEPNPDEMPPPPPIDALAITAANVPGPDLPLTLSMLPPPNAKWRDLEPFCMSVDGYAGGKRSIARCAAIAAKVMAGGPYAATTANIRIALFFWQRKAKWNDGRVDAADLRNVRDCIEVLRRRLADAPA